MSDQIVLITGGLTGIGRAAALAFAKEGASVVVSGRKEAEGKALEAELTGLGAKAAFIRADVRQDDEVRNLIGKTVARFGRLDAAVNAAGTEGKPGPVTDQTAETYADDFRHQRARHAHQHETRAAGHAVARLWQHRQHLVELWP